MFRPEYIQWQNVSLMLQKSVKISMPYPKVSRVRWYNFLIYFTNPQPPHISDLISVNMHVPDYNYTSSKGLFWGINSIQP